MPGSANVGGDGPPPVPFQFASIGVFPSAINSGCLFVQKNTLGLALASYFSRLYVPLADSSSSSLTDLHHPRSEPRAWGSGGRTQASLSLIEEFFALLFFDAICRQTIKIKIGFF